ncbi:MAG: glycosyltransferase [Lentisphaeraceae bacterium]|nr:glycosyltransferase [Lentisphaeraceae bacterium]
MFSPSDITLYVPFYNAERTISRCIDSLKNQSIQAAEILIIDDGSEQPLPENLDCRVIKHGSNKGLSAGRNTALKECHTKLIASVDADVVTEKNWLANLLNRINESSVAGVGGSMVENFQNSLGDNWRAVHMAQNWGPDIIENPKFLFGANTLFRKDCLSEVGGYDEDLRTNNEDRTISELLYSQNFKLAYEPSARCYHLRQDRTETILSAYWGWHHAKGVKEGDFDSEKGLIGRIDRVNFGISNYRYELDLKMKRQEFLVLDLLIPYVFACKDILFYCQKNNEKVPDLSQLARLLMENDYEDLELFIPEYEKTSESKDWYKKYLQIFENFKVEFMTVERLKSLDFSQWKEENISRVLE